MASEGHYEAAPASPRGSKLLSRQSNPLARANVLSVILAQWIQPMISLGARKVLDVEDVWPICERDACDSLEQRFLSVYRPLEPAPWGVSPFAAALFLTFKTEIACILVGCVVYVVGLALQAYIAQALLQFLAGEENLFHIGSGYWLMAMMSLVSLAAILALNYVFFSSSRLGVNMRSITMDIVYQKSLRLSSAARQEYTSGEILTLMSVDGERVFNNMVQGPWLFMGPLSFVISIVVLGFLFNFYAALCALVVLLVVMGISVTHGDRIASVQHALLEIIDERIKVTSEALLGIRVMKFYAWEDSLARRVGAIRDKEVNLLRKFNFYQVLNTVMLFITPIFMSGATLGLYVLIRHTITVVEAFTLIAMVNICRTSLNQLPQGIAALSKAKIAYNRIDAFLMSDEFKDFARPSTGAIKGSIDIANGRFEWPLTVQNDADTSEIVVVNPALGQSTKSSEEQSLSNHETAATHGFFLQGVNLQVDAGSLVMIVGRVGSGKSSLLSGMLGEMPLKDGSLSVNGELSYVSQENWIRNSTLRDNVLFEEPFDAKRYERVLQAAQLSMDLNSLPDADNTEIGERGINLSGGQKARVAIARAIYRSNYDVLILDDPLSAVDPHVAHAIFEHCIVGIASDKTRLLVLNSHYDLLQHADKIVVMEHGEIAGEGSYADMIERFPDLQMQDSSSKKSTTNISTHNSEDNNLLDERDVPKPAAEGDTTTNKQPATNGEKTGGKDDQEDAGRLVQAEDRVKGTVGGQVYKAYFDESGVNGIFVAFGLIAIYSVSQAARVFVDWWPGHWARNMVRYAIDPDYSGTTFGMWYLGLIVLCTALTFGRAFLMIETCMQTSKRLHDDLFRRVLQAPVNNYFDITPVGRILNRFSNDLDQMDSILPQEYQLLGQNVSMALGSLIVSAFASYWIGVSYIPVLAVFVVVGQYFKKTSRELKRLEGITRTPVYNLFGETLSGLSTIRAFKMQSTFKVLNKKVVDENSNMFLTYWCASRWLATRLDLLSVVIIFVVSLYLVATKGDVGSLTSGISLTYALMLTSVIQWVMRSVDRTDNAMTSVERLLHFRGIAQEDNAGLSADAISPGSMWPTQGSVRFSSLCLRYRSELPLVLRGVDMDIAAGEKVGICGRTGAGKSSLMVALFRICEFDRGTIFIDDVDITTVKLRELRRSLAIIPQDPVLFSGSLRENLDPFGEYSDAAIWSVLRQVHMADSLTKWGSGLDFEVAEQGDNLSVGQRQLLCIGRALLKNSKIVVLDEATANVDTATDSLIQVTIKETFVSKTVLIIAHRINTIMHCNKIAVMDAGRVAEFGSPTDLLTQPDSIFSSLAKRSGQVI